MGVFLDYFEAVVLFRIVAGADVDCAVGAVEAGGEVNHRAGGLADVLDLEAGGAEAFHEGFLEFFGVEAVVAADDHVFAAIFSG